MNSNSLRATRSKCLKWATAAGGKAATEGKLEYSPSTSSKLMILIYCSCWFRAILVNQPSPKENLLNFYQIVRLGL